MEHNCSDGVRRAVKKGGWICPTYNEDLSVNYERVNAVSQIISHWKSNSSENLQTD